MKQNGFVRSVLVVILACFACAPPPPAPPGAPAVAPRLTTAYCDAPSNTDRFLSHVHYTVFTPAYPYTMVPSIDPASLDGNIQDDLTAAFNSAPLLFQQQLCQLTGIFINWAGCTNHTPGSCGSLNVQMINNSWGFRTISSSPQRYIATSLGLWQSGGHALPFSQYETMRLQALLQQLSSNAANWSNPPPPQFVQAVPDTPGTTVLAALAHEFGHVFWYDKFVPNPGGGVTEYACKNGGTFYPPNSWSRRPPPDRWINFGQVRDRTPVVKPLKDFLDSSRFAQAGDALHAIYSDKRWESALAAFSPDEDFVETQEFLVLTNANPPLQHLMIQIYGATTFPPYDIVADIQNKPELMRKMACF